MPTTVLKIGQDSFQARHDAGVELHGKILRYIADHPGTGYEAAFNIVRAMPEHRVLVQTYAQG